nr:recombinase family protein [uncultured Agathobaculum sp.]
MSVGTTASAGKFMLTAFTVVDQLKREYIRQRQRKGIAFAKQQRKYRGRQRNIPALTLPLPGGAGVKLPPCRP